MQQEKLRRIEQLQGLAATCSSENSSAESFWAQACATSWARSSLAPQRHQRAQELINAMTEQLLSVDEMVLHLVSNSDDGNQPAVPPSTSACSCCRPGVQVAGRGDPFAGMGPCSTTSRQAVRIPARSLTDRR